MTHQHPFLRLLLRSSWLFVLGSRAAFGQQVVAPSLLAADAKPALFAPGVATTPYTEWSTSFSPDGNTVYFSQGAVYWTIVSSRRQGTGWATPKVVSFSGQWNDTDPFVSPDGKRLFFISNRPLPDSSQVKPQKTYHIWYVEQLREGAWSAPQHVSFPINLPGSSNYAPSVSSKGTLYFCARDREGHAGMASYAARWTGQQYETPTLQVLHDTQESQDPFISPDEKYVLFVSGNDLYFALKQGAGWATAQKLGKQVNNGDSNSSPYISRDGKTLYYSSARMQGFYKRQHPAPALNYEGLLKELNGPFNSFPNILTIPISLPGG
ncbi:MAG: hypothetical protein ACRYFZ_10910 [Janthinobacterium lividum]